MSLLGAGKLHKLSFICRKLAPCV